jgi:hypothetical protein
LHFLLPIGAQKSSETTHLFLMNSKMRNEFLLRPEFLDPSVRLLLLLLAEATPLLWRARGDASGASFVFVLIWLILFVLCVRWINTQWQLSALSHSKMYNARTLAALKGGRVNFFHLRLSAAACDPCRRAVLCSNSRYCVDLRRAIGISCA